MWKLTRDEANYGIPQKRLYGHSHFISDVVLSSDGNYALSGSWDKTLRLWDLAAGRTTRRFEDHTKVWLFALLHASTIRSFTKVFLLCNKNMEKSCKVFVTLIFFLFLLQWKKALQKIYWSFFFIFFLYWHIEEVGTDWISDVSMSVMFTGWDENV